ncbi:MAG: ABC transporter permease [Chitinivibrionia bacterium]|nr:ABC transporter permease [Chitinivibrionia bacterium]
MKIINLPKNIDRTWVEETGMEILRANYFVSLDFARIEVFDSAGAAFFKLVAKKNRVEMLNVGENIKRIIKSENKPQLEILEKQESLFEKTGSNVVNMYNELCTAMVVLVEMIYWGTVGLLQKRDFRKGVLGEQMYNLGYGALPITALLTFLIGIAVATQSAIQLKQFGADVFLVMLVVIGMVREMGPLMAAIILAGRTGSATTAEIATMKVQEEIDALKTMGLNEIQFVVVPKFWAISITMPLLSVWATIAGILGGFVVAYFYSGLSVEIIMDEFMKNIILKDFVISLIKSLVFSWLILWIGAYYGFGVRGGAEEVGKATTKSVVAAIFVIVIADALFSFIY